MRLVRITIPTGSREAVCGVLEEGIEYTLTDETSGREFAAVAPPSPAERVVVTVGKPADASSPPIAADLRERMDGSDAELEVRFVEVQNG